MNDRQIIELYGQRDENAIKETASKYQGYCFCIANNILADEADAEECVNDTWLKTWNSIPPQHPNNLKLFLGKITRNLSFNRYREKHREKRGSGEVALALEEMDEFLAGTIYYATLEIGDQTMYVEHSGLLKDREVVREELADVIETLIDNKEIDLTKIQL